MNIHRYIKQSKGSTFFNDDPPIYLNHVTDHYISPEHKHDFIEMCYVTKGKGVHYIEGKQYPSQVNDLFLIPVGSSHVFRPVSQDTKHRLEIINCLFSTTFLDQQSLEHASAVFGIPATKQNPFNFIQSLNSYMYIKDNNAQLYSILNNMLADFEDRPLLWQWSLVSKLIDLLIQIQRIEKCSQHQSMPVNCEIAIKYMEAHASESITLKDVADQAGIGERQLQRLFKQYCGKTFTDIWLESRIEYSCKLLREGNWRTVKEVAMQSGIRNLTSFHAAFKQHTNFTPLQYRKMIKTKN